MPYIYTSYFKETLKSLRAFIKSHDGNVVKLNECIKLGIAKIKSNPTAGIYPHDLNPQFVTLFPTLKAYITGCNHRILYFIDNDYIFFLGVIHKNQDINKFVMNAKI